MALLHFTITTVHEEVVVDSSHNRVTGNIGNVGAVVVDDCARAAAAAATATATISQGIPCWRSSE